MGIEAIYNSIVTIYMNNVIFFAITICIVFFIASTILFRHVKKEEEKEYISQKRLLVIKYKNIWETLNFGWKTLIKLGVIFGIIYYFKNIILTITLISGIIIYQICYIIFALRIKEKIVWLEKGTLLTYWRGLNIKRPRELIQQYFKFSDIQEIKFDEQNKMYLKIKYFGNYFKYKISEEEIKKLKKILDEQKISYFGKY